jgi:hypothetical protein
MLATSPQVDGALASGRLIALFNERIPARHAHHLVLPASGDLSREVATVRDWLLESRAATLT